jgi:peptide/nickel transport system substrate-binding protein
MHERRVPRTQHQSGYSRALRCIDGSAVHPAVGGLCDDFMAGGIDRRNFLRTLAWLGVSLASARGLLDEPTFAAAAVVPKRGGTLRFVCAVQQIVDPALNTWFEASNLCRNALEYLTYVDSDNITHPYLAQSWKPSIDLRTWDFALQPGVRWSNGDKFTVDDVAFNIKRWIEPRSQSANRTTFASITAFEKIDEFRFRLHLSRPVCSLPEQLYAHTCSIVHRRFEDDGGNWPKNPLGTGPFELIDYHVSRIAKFRRRKEHWGRAAYLDEIHYLDLGTEIATHVAALSAGQVDALYRVGITELDLVKRLPSVQLLAERSAQTLVMRMQHDQKPFDDLRVRRAIVLAADNAQMLKLAFRGRGTLAEHHQVAPFHPDYFALPPIKRDVGEAQRLLGAAGHPRGIDISLALGNTQGRWEQETAEVLQQNCAEAGIRLALKLVPAAEYWSMWNKVPFGMTYWAHRPLGVMALDLAYRSGSVWNESHFANAEFDAALDHALGIIDPRQRALAMAAVERILQEQAVMVQPFFADKFTAVTARVRGFRADPSDCYRMDGVWLA